MRIIKITFKQYARLLSFLSIGAMGIYASTLIAEESSAEVVAAPAVPTSLAVPKTNAVAATPKLPVTPALTPPAIPMASEPALSTQTPTKTPPAAQQIAANGSTEPATGSTTTAATTGQENATSATAKPKTILINF